MRFIVNNLMPNLESSHVSLLRILEVHLPQFGNSGTISNILFILEENKIQGLQLRFSKRTFCASKKQKNSSGQSCDSSCQLQNYKYANSQTSWLYFSSKFSISTSLLGCGCTFTPKPTWKSTNNGHVGLERLNWTVPKWIKKWFGMGKKVG